MKTNLRFVLTGSACLLAAALAARHTLQLESNSGSTEFSTLESRVSKPALEGPAHNPAPEEAQISSGIDPVLQAALEASDPARRKNLLEQWVNSVDLADIGELLERMEATRDAGMQSEIRQALLSSWSNRDLAGAVRWLAQRDVVDDLHRQVVDLLGRDMALHEPSEMLAWMKSSLPPALQEELSGPFFRQWTSTDPAAAGAKLRQLIDPESPDFKPLWNELAAQAAAQWAQTDLNNALNWAQSLPNGEAKIQALLQLSFLWTESEPQAAAAYAARQDDPALLMNVAGKWTQINPQAAAAWAAGLPAGGLRDETLAHVAAIWAVKDSAQAAAYAASLPAGNTRGQAAQSNQTTTVGENGSANPVSLH